MTQYAIHFPKKRIKCNIEKKKNKFKKTNRSNSILCAKSSN